MKVEIKPLSVNQVWQGRRFKTKAYKEYETEVMLKLSPFQFPTGRLKLCITFGMSNKMSDIDNPIKPFVDILQKKYGFNDRDIYKMELTKEIVKKGNEYIEWSIEELN